MALTFEDVVSNLGIEDVFVAYHLRNRAIEAEIFEHRLGHFKADFNCHLHSLEASHFECRLHHLEADFSIQLASELQVTRTLNKPIDSSVQPFASGLQYIALHTANDWPNWSSRRLQLAVPPLPAIHPG